MSMFRRLTSDLMRNMRKRSGHDWPGGSFWAEGTQTGRNGYLFGETPPAAGHSRKWESWEAPWYLGWGTAGIMTLLIIWGKPDTSIKAWAMPRALKELEEEDVIFAQLASDAEHAAKVKAAFSAAGRSPDLYFDQVLQRNEFEVLRRQYGSTA